MTEEKITDLVELTDPSDEDLLEIVDDPAGIPTSKKITRGSLISGLARSGANTDITSLGGLGASVLDDYEEGTFTPELWDSSASGGEGQLYTIQVGFYTKIGNRVFFQLRIAISSLGTLTVTDAAYIGGLPFTSSSTTQSFAAAYVGYAIGLDTSAAGQNVGGYVSPNGTYIALKLWDQTGGVTDMLISEVSADGNLMIAGHYFV